MMKQPDLGKKIAELRKAKSLTQEELVDKCNLNVRTLQRIEAGVVTPRSYTTKAIFAALECNINDSLGNMPDKFSGQVTPSWLEQFYGYVFDLFNLKTNTMKKVTILSIISVAIGFGLFALTNKSTAQETQKIDYSKFIKEGERGIIFLFPRGSSLYTSNMKDTADHKIGKDLIQQYQRKIFLNGKFVGRVLEGDTVIFYNRKILFRSAYWECLTSYGGKPNIHYFHPKGVTIDNLVTHVDTQYLYIEKHVIMDYHYKIFLDGVYQGQVKSGDSVLYKNGTIKILK